MTHKDIFEMFKKLIPIYADGITEWFPNGKGGIRVRHGELKQDFIFTYRSNTDWKFETVKSFMNDLSKKRKGE